LVPAAAAAAQRQRHLRSTGDRSGSLAQVRVIVCRFGLAQPREASGRRGRSSNAPTGVGTASLLLVEWLYGGVAKREEEALL
jgi:hypothetical protein